jgi:nucleotide-binding universal stress UspA family protein
MAYRTILVHMNDPRRVVSLLSYAMQIARLFDARLIGLHVSPAHDAKLPTPPAVAEGGENEAPALLESIFRDLTEKERFISDWRPVSFEHSAPAKIVVARARAADLVVVNQADPAWDRSRLLDFPDRLAIESGRPVIVVPKAHPAAVLPKTVVIAWNGSREATRALFDALPLLKGARKVELVTIHEATDKTLLNADEDVLPLGAIAEALAGHGVKPLITNLKATGGTVGEQICAHAIGQQADLIVMGAYGHTRLREFVFGGATRYVLGHMPVPVLLSH